MRPRPWNRSGGNQRNVVVIGGGISGLAAAHRFLELSREKSLNLKITVLEASPRLGGLIETERRGDFLIEGGPDAFLAEKPWAKELCQRIGMGDELIPTSEGLRRSFIAWKGALEPMPEGFYLMAPSGLKSLMECRILSLPGRLRMACERFIPRRTNTGDESVASFVRRRLGPEALQRIAQPMIGGIYAADLEKLSLQAALPQFHGMEKEHGSVLSALRKGGLRAGAAGSEKASGPRYSMFLTPRFGMIRLVEMLARRMLEVELKTNTLVTGIERTGRGWSVRSKQGDLFPADALCVALPAHAAAALLKSAAPAAAQDLEGISCESAATVTMAFNKSDLPVPFSGFGFVVPAGRAGGVVGCTFSSQKFAHRAPSGTVLLRAFVGGALAPEAVGKENSVLESSVRVLLKETLQVQAAPRMSAIHRYPKSMPQYQVGHLERVERIEKEVARLPGLAVTGNWSHGVGIPHCIHQAELAAEKLCSGLTTLS